MIKNGNYHYFDFDAHREEIIDVLCEFYGRENEETVRNRLDRTNFVPYMKYAYVKDYYNQLMAQYDEEVLEEFQKQLGYPLDEETKKFVFNNASSKLFAAIVCGQLFDERTMMFTQEGLDNIQSSRKKVCELFDIKDEDPVPAIQELCRKLTKAMNIVEENHPCDVFSDVRKYINNKNDLVQKFLLYVSKYIFPLSKRDMEILDSPNFDSFDIENLACQNMLFENCVEYPGYIEYFTSKKKEKYQNAVEIKDKIDIVEGKLIWFVLQGGDKYLQNVTVEELFGLEDHDLDDAYFIRLSLDLRNVTAMMPFLEVSTEVADTVENVRKHMVEMQFNGCKFNNNLNRVYGDCFTHENNEKLFCVTNTGFKNQLLTSPVQTIFFREGGFSLEEQLKILMHEVNHAISFGKPIYREGEKKCYGKMGVTGFLLDVNNGCYNQYIRTGFNDYRVTSNLEENLNEYQAKILRQIYMNKYGCPFEESDIPCSFEQPIFVTEYELWDLLTKKFIEIFGDRYKDARIHDEARIYYDNEGVPASNLREELSDFINHKYNRTFNPEHCENMGFLSFGKTYELSKLIEEFNVFVENLLCEYDMDVAEWLAQSGEVYDSLPDEYKNAINDFIRRAEKIVDDMYVESESISRRATDKFVGRGKTASVVGEMSAKAVDIVNFIKESAKEKLNKVASKKLSIGISPNSHKDTLETGVKKRKINIDFSFGNKDKSMGE